VLRTALLPGLLRNLQLAQRHQQRRFAGFELARVFREVAKGELPAERYEFAVLLWGLRGDWYEEREQLDFYDAKGVLESISSAVLGQVLSTQRDQQLEHDAPFLHPRRSARLYSAAEALGVIGELHPDVADAFDLQGRAVYAVLDVARLSSVMANAHALPAKLNALPRFPATTRDLAVVVSEELAAGDVAEALRNAAPALLESVRLFDIYRGAPVPEAHKSLAFHLVYRDPLTTLTDKRVDDIHANLTAAAQQQFGGAVRK
jgi:phenylalanyl-tRNA synthetase beta chain